MKTCTKLTRLGIFLVIISLCLVTAIPAQAADYNWNSITETAIIDLDNNTAGLGFGYPVVISGDIALIGASGTDNGAGAVYVYTRSGTTWNQTDVLMPSDPEMDMGFGLAIAFDGDTALIGGPFINLIGENTRGRVYVFTRSGTDWTQRAELMPNDSSVDDYFGVSIALDGETALIGARGRDNFTGAAYIFTGSGDTWTQRAKLIASDREPNSSAIESIWKVTPPQLELMLGITIPAPFTFLPAAATPGMSRPG